MHVLPTIGLEKWGILRAKTASFLDIHIFGYLLSVEQFNRTIKRLHKGTRIELREDYYSRDLWSKNYQNYADDNQKPQKYIKKLRKIFPCFIFRFYKITTKYGNYSRSNRAKN